MTGQLPTHPRHLPASVAVEAMGVDRMRSGANLAVTQVRWLADRATGGPSVRLPADHRHTVRQNRLRLTLRRLFSHSRPPPLPPIPRMKVVWDIPGIITSSLFVPLAFSCFPVVRSLASCTDGCGGEVKLRHVSVHHDVFVPIPSHANFHGFLFLLT